MVALLAALMLVVVGCGGGSKGGGGDDGPPKAPGDAGTGPYFGECGNVTTEEVVKITGFGGLQNTVNNTSSCEWSSNNLRTGAVDVFELVSRLADRPRARHRTALPRRHRERQIKGHKGFIAWDETICEIGIAFGADFFEWSVRADYTSQMPTQQICAATRQLSTMSIERSSS